MITLQPLYVAPEQQPIDEAIEDCILNEKLCTGGFAGVNLIDTAEIVAERKKEPVSDKKPLKWYWYVSLLLVLLIVAYLFTKKKN